jgi:hypothetical protein
MLNILAYSLLQKKSKGSKAKRDAKDLDATRGAIEFRRGDKSRR